SLAGVSGRGTLSERPTTPSRATRSMCGLRAACKGVRLPSDACGSSAQPSGITMAYFMRSLYDGPSAHPGVAMSHEPPTPSEAPTRLPEPAPAPSAAAHEQETVTAAPPAQPTPPGAPPELLDHPRYRVVRLLGQGGMG